MFPSCVFLTQLLCVARLGLLVHIRSRSSAENPFRKNQSPCSNDSMISNGKVSMAIIVENSTSKSFMERTMERQWGVSLEFESFHEKTCCSLCVVGWETWSRPIANMSNFLLLQFLAGIVWGHTSSSCGSAFSSVVLWSSILTVSFLLEAWTKRAGWKIGNQFYKNMCSGKLLGNILASKVFGSPGNLLFWLSHNSFVANELLAFCLLIRLLHRLYRLCSWQFISRILIYYESSVERIS